MSKQLFVQFYIINLHKNRRKFVKTDKQDKCSHCQIKILNLFYWNKPEIHQNLM